LINGLAEIKLFDLSFYGVRVGFCCCFVLGM